MKENLFWPFWISMYFGRTWPFWLLPPTLLWVVDPAPQTVATVALRTSRCWCFFWCKKEGMRTIPTQNESCFLSSQWFDTWIPWKCRNCRWFGWKGQNMTWSILRSQKMGCFLMTCQLKRYQISHQVGSFGCLVMRFWQELVVWVPEYPVWRSTELNLLAVWTPWHASGCLRLPSPEMLEVPWDSNLEHVNDRILWFATFRYPLHGSRFFSTWTCIDVLFHSFSLGSEASILGSFIFSSGLHQEDLDGFKITRESAKLLARCTYCIIYVLCFSSMQPVSFPFC